MWGSTLLCLSWSSSPLPFLISPASTPPLPPVAVVWHDSDRISKNHLIEIKTASSLSGIGVGILVRFEDHNEVGDIW